MEQKLLWFGDSIYYSNLHFINKIIIYYCFFLKEMAKVSAAQAVVDVANEVKVIASTKCKGVVLLIYIVIYGA